MFDEIGTKFNAQSTESQSYNLILSKQWIYWEFILFLETVGFFARFLFLKWKIENKQKILKGTHKNVHYKIRYNFVILKKIKKKKLVGRY